MVDLMKLNWIVLNVQEDLQNPLKEVKVNVNLSLIMVQEASQYYLNLVMVDLVTIWKPLLLLGMLSSLSPLQLLLFWLYVSEVLYSLKECLENVNSRERREASARTES